MSAPGIIQQFSGGHCLLLLLAVATFLLDATSARSTRHTDCCNRNASVLTVQECTRSTRRNMFVADS